MWVNRAVARIHPDRVMSRRDVKATIEHR